MAKFTRKSYKRKKVVLGVTLFASIALISTGFAAFVITKNADANKDGTVVVGTVKDANISFVGVAQTYDSFIFDCKKDDLSGRVYFEEEKNNKDGERLTITISGAVTNPAYLKSGTIKMEVPAEVTAAVSKKYIALPSCVSDAQTLTFEDITVSEDTTTKYGVDVGTKLKSFSYDITFTWGEAFNRKNPGEYFDEDEAGKAISYEQVKSTMADFYSTLNTTGRYKVTISASANA